MNTADLFATIAQIDSALYRLGVTDVWGLDMTATRQQVIIGAADFRRVFAGCEVRTSVSRSGAFAYDHMYTVVGDWKVSACATRRPDLDTPTTVVLPEVTS